MPPKKKTAVKSAKTTDSNRAQQMRFGKPEFSIFDTSRDKLKGLGNKFTVTGIFEEDLINFCKREKVKVLPLIRLNPGSRFNRKAGQLSGQSSSVAGANRRSVNTPNRLQIQLTLQSGEDLPMDANSETAVRRQRVAPSSRVLKSSFITESQTQVDTSDDSEPDRGNRQRVIWVDYKEASDATSLSEVMIRGWYLDRVMMEALGFACPIQNHLRTLHMWKVDLSILQYDLLADMVDQCPYLTVLQLDENPELKNLQLNKLLGEGCRLQELSLRFCELTDYSAYTIGSFLGTNTTWNSTLVQLNLANNRIGDLGAEYIATGLKTNRTLAVLNLAGNRIADKGAAALKVALSHFPLDTEQITIRRQESAECERKLSTHKSLQVPTSSKTSTAKPTGPPTPTGKMEKEKSIASPRGKKNKDGGEGKQKHGRVAVADPKSDSGHKKLIKRGSLTNISRRRPSNGSSLPQLEVVGGSEVDMNRADHPFVDVASIIRGQLCLVGNRVLQSLNLSRNPIGEVGMKVLLEMILDQAMSNYNHRQIGKGLLRLVLHRNAVAKDNETVSIINRRMAVRDPTLRVPILNLKKRGLTPCAMPPIPL